MPPSLRRQQSLKNHYDNFDSIIKGAMEDLEQTFGSLVGNVVKDAQGRDLALGMIMTQFASDLQRKVDRCTLEIVDAAWSKFDKNEDGSLQKPEMQTLVKSVLTDLNQSLTTMVKDAMEPAADNLKEWIESDNVGPIGMGHTLSSTSYVLDANVHARIEAAANKLSQLLSMVMLALLNESRAISDEIFDTIDANKDGNVTKREFSKGFTDAFGTVVDFSKITREVLRKRPTLQRTKSIVNPTDNACAGLVVLTLASAVLVLLMRKH